MIHMSDCPRLRTSTRGGGLGELVDSPRVEHEQRHRKDADCHHHRDHRETRVAAVVAATGAPSSRGIGRRCGGHFGWGFGGGRRVMLALEAAERGR
jgi:hypothetical protein